MRTVFRAKSAKRPASRVMIKHLAEEMRRGECDDRCALLKAIGVIRLLESEHRETRARVEALARHLKERDQREAWDEEEASAEESAS